MRHSLAAVYLTQWHTMSLFVGGGYMGEEAGGRKPICRLLQRFEVRGSG